MKVSLVMGSWKRKELLNLNLWSLTQQKINHDLEIIVCNDYLPDGTEEICNKYKDKLNIKYVFTGQRHINNIIWRSAGFALNIGVKQSSGDIIILTCPEIFHLNDTINLIVEPLIKNEDIMSIGESIYFDDTGHTIIYLEEHRNLNLPIELIKEISSDPECTQAVKMPYLMGMYKKEYMNIKGYDEDSKGYAGEDNDLISRLELNGLKHHKTKAKAVHLFHGSRCDSKVHYDNPLWKLNFDLFSKRKGIIIRNQGREWGVIK